MKTFFENFHQSKKSKARLGEIKTAHGVIKTPAFVAVGTKGTVKALTPELVKNIGTQVAFVNTYHLVTHPGVEIIFKADGIHKYSRLNMPLMSDSGGFQVFSLSRKNKYEIRNTKSQTNSKSLNIKNLNLNIVSDLDIRASNLIKKADIRGDEQPLMVKISNDGVKFRSTFDGKLIEFTPEKSMEYQEKIGADINMAFDECIYYGSTYEYSKKATDRTHRWLERCVKYVKSQKAKVKITDKNLKIENSLKTENGKLKIDQYLYGVIQGGVFEDLRKKSAEFVVSQGTPGVAIGGLSVGESKKEIRDQVEWVSDFLPKDRPVHLLGVGHFNDILDLVVHGVDTFDCVEPTRLARMGTVYQISNFEFLISNQFSITNKPISKHEGIDITRNVYKDNFEPLDLHCKCYVCKNFTKSYLHHLFKQREILGYTLATYHNLWVMERLFDKIREAISEDRI